MYNQQPDENTSSNRTRTIGRIVAVILATACVAPLVVNFLSTGDQPETRNMVIKNPIVSQDHHNYGGQQSCNYVQENAFSFPYAVPSCAWLSTSSSASYQCVDANTVKKIEYDAIGCSKGSGTITTETTIVNGQNGAIVDCSNANTCFAVSAVAQNTQCPVQKRLSLSDIRSKEDLVLGVCFGIFGPKKQRYGCDDNELVTDQFEGADCTSVFYRTTAPKCAMTSATAAQVHSCSRGAPEPRDFPEPNVERESCGKVDGSSRIVQLNQCYATSFSTPTLHRCEKRNGKVVHVETLFTGNDCSGSVVMEMSIPTEICVNGIEEECEGRFGMGGVSSIPNGEAIVGRLYDSAACSGVGIGVRVKKNVEFSVGFKKAKFVCSAGGMEEQVNGKAVGTFAVNTCQPITNSLLGQSGNQGALGSYVKVEQCP